jgi:hypothetical protein
MQHMRLVHWSIRIYLDYVNIWNVCLITSSFLSMRTPPFRGLSNSKEKRGVNSSGHLCYFTRCRDLNQSKKARCRLGEWILVFLAFLNMSYFSKLWLTRDALTDFHKVCKFVRIKCKALLLLFILTSHTYIHIHSIFILHPPITESFFLHLWDILYSNPNFRFVQHFMGNTWWPCSYLTSATVRQLGVRPTHLGVQILNGDLELNWRSTGHVISTGPSGQVF